MVVPLLNHGNTCYLNVILQGLLEIKPFTDIICNLELNDDDHSLLIDKKHFEIITGLRELFLQAQTWERTKDVIIKPSQVLFNHFFKDSVNQQQDAHEYLMLLLDSISHLTREITPLFLGNITYSIRCTVCGSISKSVEPFQVLSLDISSNDIASVDDALTQFFYTEILDEENAYECSNCHVIVRAVKMLSLSAIPPVIILHLKRFLFDGTKLHKAIQFNQFLHISQSGKSSRTGKLATVIVHRGNSSQRGHYYCYKMSSSSKQWFKYDDSKITKSSWEIVLNEATNAYLLFYSFLNS